MRLKGHPPDVSIWGFLGDCGKNEMSVADWVLVLFTYLPSSIFHSLFLSSIMRDLKLECFILHFHTKSHFHYQSKLKETRKEFESNSSVVWKPLFTMDFFLESRYIITFMKWPLLKIKLPLRGIVFKSNLVRTSWSFVTSLLFHVSLVLLVTLYFFPCFFQL